jgi:hypothetical protein
MLLQAMKRTAMAALLALSACVGPTVVMMKNPQTGEIKRCSGSNNGLSLAADSWAAKGCADGYQTAGWQRLN